MEVNSLTILFAFAAIGAVAVMLVMARQRDFARDEAEIANAEAREARGMKARLARWEIELNAREARLDAVSHALLDRLKAIEIPPTLADPIRAAHYLRTQADLFGWQRDGLTYRVSEGVSDELTKMAVMDRLYLGPVRDRTLFGFPVIVSDTVPEGEIHIVTTERVRVTL